MPATIIQYEDTSSLLRDPEALRARANEDGFLFIKGLLPKDKVMDLRLQFLQVLDRWGWLDRSKPLGDGYTNKEAIEKENGDQMNWAGTGVHQAAYLEIQKLQAFHELAHHPNIIKLYQALFDAPVLPHPRHIARLIMPASYTSPTPAHQDYIHIQGTKNVWTLWFPVGDCPREMGNLSMVRGSHKNGLLTVAPAAGAGGLETQLCGDDYEWVEGDFEAGDVVTFSATTIHKALKPEVTDRVRMSCDCRYQPAQEEIETNSLLPHCLVGTWDQIYEGWDREDLKYYWQREALKMGQWDEAIRWQKEKIC